MKIGRYLLIATVACVGLSGPAMSQAQPSDPPAKVDQPKKPKAQVYDEKADATKQIDAAIKNAKKNNRRVLIQWGGNWCHWCIKLHDLMGSNEEIKKTLNYEYDVINIDIGHADKNLDLVKKYGAEGMKEKGVPYLTVLDGDGKVVANQETGPLEFKDESKQAHDPAKVLSFLKEHQAGYPEAADLLAAGLAQAKAEHKRVFVHFGAPWCGWCHKLENWMALPEIESILAKDFIDLKIDQDRTKGAAAIMKQYNPKPGGIPWIVLLDEDGKALADANGPKGNIGYPAAPEEVAHFVKMLNMARRAMTEKDVEAINTSLTEAGKKLNH